MLVNILLDARYHTSVLLIIRSMILQMPLLGAIRWKFVGLDISLSGLSVGIIVTCLHKRGKIPYRVMFQKMVGYLSGPVAVS